MDLGEVVNKSVIDSRKKFFNFNNVEMTVNATTQPPRLPAHTSQESTPPDPGGETFPGLFDLLFQ